MSAERRRSTPASGSRSLKPKVVGGGAGDPRRAPRVPGRPVRDPAGRGTAPGRAPAGRRHRARPPVPPAPPLRRPARAADARRRPRPRRRQRRVDAGRASSTSRSSRPGAAASRSRPRGSTDGTGFATATWFGRRYIEKRVRPGDLLLVSGKVKHRNGDLIFEGPEFQPADAANLLHVGRIVPVYRLTSGLTANRLRGAMRVALDRAGHDYPEYVPAAIRAAEDVPPIGEALEAAHYPTTFEARDAALRRLALDELLALQLGMVARRRARGRARTLAIAVDDATDARIRSALEGSLSRKLGETVSLTADQGTAIDEAAADLARPVPMLRLIQGDVGSGKTAVAAWALAAAALAGRQAAMLAPTDLLARQHHATLSSLLEDLGLPITLLTGSLSGEGRRNATEAIASGQAAIVVGTHALLQDKVSFADLALAVVDEQHRFGVEQRGALEAKATRGAPTRPAHDRDPDPAHPRPGPVRGPRRVDAPDATRRARADPHGDPPAGRPRGHVGPRAGRGGAGTPDVRGRAADRGRGDGVRWRRGRGRQLRRRRRPARRGRGDGLGRRRRGRVRAAHGAARAAAGGPRPRAPQARRPRRRDGPLPRRGPRRARRDDGGRGGGRRRRRRR